MQQELTASKPIPVCDTAINAWLDANDKYCTKPPQAMKKEDSNQYFPPSAFFRNRLEMSCKNEQCIKAREKTLASVNKDCADAGSEYVTVVKVDGDDIPYPLESLYEEARLTPDKAECKIRDTYSQEFCLVQFFKQKETGCLRKPKSKSKPIKECTLEEERESVCTQCMHDLYNTLIKTPKEFGDSMVVQDLKKTSLKKRCGGFEQWLSKPVGASVDENAGEEEVPVFEAPAKSVNDPKGKVNNAGTTSKRFSKNGIFMGALLVFGLVMQAI